MKDREDFEESKHPRDESGQFASGGGSGATAASKPAGGSGSREKIAERLIGQTTSDGVKITGVSGHAFDRLGGRKISTGRVEKMLQSTDIKPGHTEATRCYDIPGSRMVVDVKTGNVVTVMWRRGGKK